MSRADKRIALLHLAGLLIIAAGAVTAGLAGNWPALCAWIVAAVWLVTAYLNQRCADRAMTLYVLAVGRNAGEYARGIRLGYRLAYRLARTTTPQED